MDWTLDWIGLLEFREFDHGSFVRKSYVGAFEICRSNEGIGLAD
jgi:hypothetical protein